MGDEEFDRLMSFFRLSSEERLSRFSEILTDTVAFFNKFREVMEKGSSDEKTDMLHKALELQKVMQSETDQMCESIGITEEDLKAYAQDAANFSKEQWNEMQVTRGELDKQVDAISNAVKFSSSSAKGEDQPQRTKAKKHKMSSKKWIKS